MPLPEVPTDFQLNTANLANAEFVTANCACTKFSLVAAGGFDERFRLAWREDSDLEFRLLENRIPIHRVENAVVVHPARDTEWGISIREQKKSMFDALLYKKYPVLFRKKIQSSPSWNYYLIILGCLLVAGGLITQDRYILLTGMILYFGLTGTFVARRLKSTSRSGDHVVEMIATSVVIPFASVYWKLYGSIKYRVLYY